jgi:transposase InsO family protein
MKKCSGPSKDVADTLVRGIKPIRIYPGSTWENGYNELFNGILSGKFKRPNGSP